MTRVLQTSMAASKYVPPTPFQAGVECVAISRYTMVVGTDFASTDRVEFLPLPAYCRIVGYRLMTQGTWTGITANVGVLDGTYGDAASITRDFVASSSLFTAVDLTVINSSSQTTVNTALLLAPMADVDRGIALQPSGAVTGATTKKLVLVMFYANGTEMMNID